MTRLSDAFAAARAQGRTALVCYVMGGDGDTAALLRAVDDAGADVIELGLPFSDPIADGPVLQAAATRAIAAHATLRDLLATAGKLRLRAPMVAMGYMNPIETMGSRAFARALREAGLCGAIVPDLPLEEAEPVRADLAAEGLDLVPLVAPTTPPERAAQIAKTARGFVYYVSVTGVTGARAALPEDLERRLAELRAISQAPVAVGFGISKPEHAAALKGKVDGVVVGTALVALHHERGVQAAADLVRALRAAL
ncbi:MAG TPA: tryptophan synthase subunit alpha [Myxococcales bacterium]|jgi:tryptophan synthase alpha chain|nr:tryptophan synthase subunit alpha [Myxococcales bacterium]